MSFTFTLSSGAHGKALLALAAVGARSVDASLSPACRGLFTFISIWQHTGRQSRSLPPPVWGRLGAGEELLHLQQAFPKGPMPGLSSIPHLSLHPPCHEVVIRAGITDLHGQDPAPERAEEGDPHGSGCPWAGLQRGRVCGCACVCAGVCALCRCVYTCMREHEGGRLGRPWGGGIPAPGGHDLP